MRRWKRRFAVYHKDLKELAPTLAAGVLRDDRAEDRHQQAEAAGAAGEEHLRREAWSAAGSSLV